MKFTVRQHELTKALSVIKNSAAMLKLSDSSSTIWLSIKTKKEEGGDIIEFLANNSSVWAGSSIDKNCFTDIDEMQLKDNFNVEEDGIILVDSTSFLGKIFAYPKDAIMTFHVVSKKGKNDSEPGKFLQVVSQIGKKKKQVESGFLVKEDTHSEPKPRNEERKKITTQAGKLFEAVKSVEFAAGTQREEQFLSGCKVEFYDNGDDISTSATDRSRICWYDTKARQKREEEPVVVVPIKESFFSAIKNLDMADPVDILIGNEQTIIEQKHQWHAVPNIIDAESLPDWRDVVKRLAEEDRMSLKLPKTDVLDFIKRALTESSSKFGIKLSFDAQEKLITLAIQKIGNDNVLYSYHKEKIWLDDEDCCGDLKDTRILLTIENIRDIVSRYSSEKITFKIKDNSLPVEVLSEQDKFEYITSTVQQYIEEDAEEGTEEDMEEESVLENAETESE